MADVATVAPRGSQLTPAERRALAVRDETDTDAQAAEILGCSVHTLRSHLRNARSRLGVHSTDRAIRRALA